MRLRKFFISCLFILFSSGCATGSRFLDKSTGISENSSDVIRGVRLYGGKLPSYIEYRSLGEVEGTGRSWEVVQQMFQAREEMTLKAREERANQTVSTQLLENKGIMLEVSPWSVQKEFITITPFTTLSFAVTK